MWLRKGGCRKGLISRGVMVGVRVLRVHVRICTRVHPSVRVHPSHLLRHALGEGEAQRQELEEGLCGGDLPRPSSGASCLSFPAESVNQISLFLTGIGFTSETSGLCQSLLPDS